jgi:pyrrolidone-carboxylate peptidase
VASRRPFGRAPQVADAIASRMVASRTRRVLVTGFGRFLDVIDNPSGRIARAVDGRIAAGVAVTGLELPVSFVEGPALAIRAALALDPIAVIGLGVDRRTTTVDVETRGYNRGAGLDVDERTLAVLEPGGPPLVYSNLDAATFAGVIGGRVDDDAGRYVCNAWLYTVGRALMPARQVIFVHVPDSGLDPELLLAGIGVLFGEDV